MAQDIFKLFKKSIEKVQMMKMPRGTLDIEAAEYNVSLKAIVKRRDGMVQAIENSEDRQNTTSIHFKVSDAQYIEVGNYVNIDGQWRTIERIRDGKDFATGKSSFIYAFVGEDIVKLTNDPVWS